MNIAVNTRLLLGSQLEGIGYFTREVFQRLALKYPEHQFYFIFDRDFDPQFITAPNIHPIVAGPPARHPLLWKFWYDVRLPLVLKKIKADVFVSPDGFCSLTTSIPQCLVVHDLGFLHQPQAYKSSHLPFYRYYTPRFIKKAKAVATVSSSSKQDLVKHYKILPGKISIVHSAVKDVFIPASEEEKERIKQKITGGKEFFIYIGAIQPRKNLVNLLKAFSLFKKRLKSEMKLVLCGRQAWKNNEFLELLKTYKFREDVVLTGYLPEEELVPLLGAAYAMVYPSFFEGFGVPVLEAMKTNVPVLTSAGTSMEEIGEDAALYFDPADIRDMGDKLMMIYKDETLRSRLIEKGKIISQKYSWDRTADLVWEAICKAAGFPLP
jgi:glycosyltransferase involved in cell wall biosynthesis